MNRILTFGEVLWDIFEKEKTIGGAPFNFSAHCRKLGADVSFLSAVGDDELGRETRETVRNMGLDDGGVAVLKGRKTGYCAVTIKDGSPYYDLAFDVAYDHIPYPETGFLRGSYDAFYFGTLASRHPDSAETLRKLLKECGTGVREIFFDVNIRGTFWSREFLDGVLPHVTMLKLSREEAGVFGTEDESALCERLFREYGNLKLILLTKDKDGASVYGRDAVFHSQKPESKAISTVGAGDSFSACFLCNALAGHPVPECLRRSVLLSDFVVTRLGAIPDYPNSLFSSIRP
ncbi:MAG: hypothetical protein ILO68_03575 [Clostridia bacterium]|nr:hypothetical protein [Clostridia bacterium]